MSTQQLVAFTTKDTTISNNALKHFYFNLWKHNRTYGIHLERLLLRGRIQIMNDTSVAEAWYCTQCNVYNHCTKQYTGLYVIWLRSFHNTTHIEDDDEDVHCSLYSCPLKESQWANTIDFMSPIRNKHCEILSCVGGNVN